LFFLYFPKCKANSEIVFFFFIFQNAKQILTFLFVFFISRMQSKF